MSEQENWEKNTIKQLLLAGIVEQRRKRYWSIFFRALVLGYVFFITGYVLYDSVVPEKTDIVSSKHTAVVDIVGAIASGSDATRADIIIKSLRDAVKSKPQGVVVRINTPGGSPVQSGLIAKEILRLRKKEPGIPIYSAIEDSGTSAGYRIAAATEKIYAFPDSVVGSIGVLLNGFGFVDSLNLLGVERRLMTAGKNKGMLDPFSPEKTADKVYMQNILDEVHQLFIDEVKEGRGSKLKDNAEIFSGRYWTGVGAKTLGLVDELGGVHDIAENEFKSTKLINYTSDGDLLGKLMKKFGLATKSLLNSFFFENRDKIIS